MEPRLLQKWLQTAGPEYEHILLEAIHQEEANKDNPHYLGWEWHEVKAYPARLMKLVVAGIIRINYKSNTATCYLLTDRAGTAAALGGG